MISQKTKYGLKAVIYLAKRQEQGPVLIADLAKAEGMPQKFLEAILLELRKAGILMSKKGKGGGYGLAKPPRQIMLGEIIRLLDGPLAPVPCVSQTAYAVCPECASEQECEIRLIMKEVRDAISNVLDKTTLADLLERSKKGQDILNFVI